MLQHKGMCYDESSPAISQTVVAPLPLSTRSYSHVSSAVTDGRLPCKLHVDCLEPLVDQILHIQVSQLKPRQQVTLLARIDEGGKRHHSLAHYNADHNGCCDLQTSPSIGGLYKGVEPMGLFWSMKQDPGQKPGLRLLKRTTTTPLTTVLEVYDGHCDDVMRLIEESPLANTVINRWYLAKHVKRLEVREHGIKGTFFIPIDAGGELYAGIVDMFGGVGGTVEHRAALMASKGFATLALEYMNTDAKIEYQTNLEYFEGALEWLLKQPNVISHAAGVIGTSKGAELAMLMGIISPKVKAIACINGLHLLSVVDMTHGDDRFSAMDFPGTFSLKEGGTWFKGHIASLVDESITEKCAIPTERNNAHVLFINCSDDECCDPKSTDHMIARMAQNGKSHLCERILYQGAGHLLEPPYSPHYRQTYTTFPGSLVLWGGETEAHARAQEDVWPRMINFFRTRLA